MKELITQIISELKSAWRFRWVALACAWVVCLLGWAVVLSLPDRYEAEAIFFVGKTRLDDVLNERSDDRSLIAKVRQQILSAPVLERVASETALDARAETEEQKDDLIRALAEKIDIRPIRSGSLRPGNETIIRIRYRDVDREMALQVVGKILDTFRADVVTGRASGSDDALEFLLAGIEEYGVKLSDQEQALSDFKRENVGLLPGEGRGYFNTLQSAVDATRQMESEMAVLVDRRTALTQQLQGESPILSGEVSGSSGGLPQSDLDTRISVLESDIQEMLTRYTEKWPDVISARDQLAQLYAQREEMLNGFTPDGVGVASNNPVYQEIRIALNDTNISIAELEGRLATSQAKVKDLQDKIDVIPQVEAKLAELTRDYAQISDVYDDMRAKYEQENLRRKRLGWDGVTFETMEPPRSSFDPVSPRRSLFLMAVAVAGVGLGGMVAFLLQQLNPVVADPQALRRLTGLPILGTVSMVWESRFKGRRRRELTAFIGATAMIFLAVGLLLVFQDPLVRLGEIFMTMVVT